MQPDSPHSGPAAVHFSSRWAMLATALGIAIGTGNIWRFPRVAAANGGGVFILLWMVFLFLWSIPLLTAESAIGRWSRKGTLGSFQALAGRSGLWMGGFVALVTTGIMSYYSVVTGWCFKYFSSSLTGAVNAGTGPEYWHDFAGSAQAEAFHLAAALVTGLIVVLGVRIGIERTARVFIPVLGAILVYATLRALFLPGSFEGVKFLFHFDPADFTRPRIYLEALSQSAWSTGAGWGLLLTYSVYSRSSEPVVGNSLIMGLGNNTASLLAALAVIPTVFALLPAGEAVQVAQATGENSTGLTFIWIPRLLGGTGGGQLMLALFFLALSLAALSSLISMFELAVRNLIDLGLRRRSATAAVAAFIALAGSPSALNSTFFDNQDWVWGLGLLVNGLFFCLAVNRFGAGRFREQMVNIRSSKDIRLGKVFEPLISRVIPFQFVLLLGWWFYRSVGWDPANWWNPFSTFSIGSCLAQWGLAAVLMIVLAPRLAGLLGRRTAR
ncbi:MAG: sodium-dependent transporter [Candidatus Glassbacteria bacterium]|nr:sodium-dependent transporter [Candidatus Glassbacteria bacterium]